jgi:hypothetical protein
MTIKPSRLYRMRDDLPHDEAVICLAAGIKRGQILWCDGNRPSSLGGYIGNFRDTYTHALGTSPGSKRFDNFPMRYFDNFGLSAD